MENLAQMILQKESPSKISDYIKDQLNLKAVDKIDQFRPEVAANLFGVEDEE